MENLELRMAGGTIFQLYLMVLMCSDMQFLKRESNCDNNL